MRTIFTALLLLISSTVLLAQRTSCWEVSNTTLPAYGLCPYDVCFDMVIVNTITNQPLPGTGISVCHSVASGTTTSFCYPASYAPPYAPKVLAIRFFVSGTPYTVPLSGSVTYGGVTCYTGTCGGVTYWTSLGPLSYRIEGACLIGR